MQPNIISVLCVVTNLLLFEGNDPSALLAGRFLGPMA